MPNQNAPLILREDGVNAVQYTYRVTWKVRYTISTVFTSSLYACFCQESDTPWATRWDNYLHIFDPVSFLALFMDLDFET